MNTLLEKMASQMSATPTATERILVVDDIEDNILLLQTILESEGYEVEVAKSGPVALDMIEAAPPALVLLDVMMPEMSGFEVTKQIRQNPDIPFIPVLLISGYTEANPANSFDAGADGFIRKPIDFDELLSRIRAILQPETRVE